MENLDLSIFCKTKAQANEFIGRLAAISEKVYEVDFNIEKIALEQLGIQKKDSFLKLLAENNVPQKADELKIFLTKLQDFVAKLPVLTMAIAFEPTEESLKSFSDWFFLNVKKQVLFTITVDPSAIAGAVISYNGKHVNCTIKSDFDHIVQDAIRQPTAPTFPPPAHHENIQDLHVGR